jgi:hypothetical protein
MNGTEMEANNWSTQREHLAWVPKRVSDFTQGIKWSFLLNVDGLQPNKAAHVVYNF